MNVGEDGELVPAHQHDRRLEQLADGRQIVLAVGEVEFTHIEGLPGQRLLLEQLAASVFDQEAGIVVLVVPVVAGAVGELAE